MLRMPENDPVLDFADSIDETFPMLAYQIRLDHAELVLEEAGVIESGQIPDSDVSVLEEKATA